MKKKRCIVVKARDKKYRKEAKMLTKIVNSAEWSDLEEKIRQEAAKAMMDLIMYGHVKKP